MAKQRQSWGSKLGIILAVAGSAVGLGNFLAELPRYYRSREEIRFYQPVHNILLLAMAETGILGFGFFLWLVVKTLVVAWQKGEKALIYSLLIIFLTGLFDHYWLTLQQGQLMLTLVFGLVWQGSGRRFKGARSLKSLRV